MRIRHTAGINSLLWLCVLLLPTGLSQHGPDTPFNHALPANAYASREYRHQHNGPSLTANLCNSEAQATLPCGATDRVQISPKPLSDLKAESKGIGQNLAGGWCRTVEISCPHWGGCCNLWVGQISGIRAIALWRYKTTPVLQPDVVVLPIGRPPPEPSLA